jgi:precorrin-6B methylase 2
MKKSLIEKIMYSIRFLIFDYIGKRFQVDSTKHYMDKIFILFEKIAINFDVLSSVYLSLYAEIVANEIELAQITDNDTILVIGGGTLPVTPVLYTRYTKASIVSIDKDPQAIRYSKKFISNQDLNSQITIKNGKGELFSIKDFSVIVVVYGIRGAYDVLRHLSENMHHETRILFRTTYDYTNESIIEDFELKSLFTVKKHIRSATLGQVDTFLLSKKT